MKKKKPTVKILVGYHRPAVLLKDEVLTPIHLGRALATEASKDGSMSKEDYQWMLDNMIGDDTGENISEENRKYCELTALYWAWKNYDKLGNPDYIGFMHYRRHLSFNLNKHFNDDKYGFVQEKEINEEYLSKYHLDADSIVDVLSRYDIVVAERTDLKRLGTITPYNHYETSQRKLHIRDYEKVLAVLNRKYPEYTEDAIIYNNANYAYFTNVFVMKRDIYKQYCEWLFNILQEADELIDVSDYNIQEVRALAYIAEWLCGIFIVHFERKGKKVLELQETLVLNVDVLPEIKPSFTQNNIPICLSMDANYVLYTGVTVHSIIANMNEKNNYDILILCRGVGDKEQKKIGQLAAGHKNVRIRFIDVKKYINNIMSDYFFVISHFSEAVYYRVFIFKILTAYDKVLYVDSDLVLTEDIAGLYQTDIGDKALGAVPDTEVIRMYFTDIVIKNYLDKTLELENPYRYFNSGVLIMNLEKMRTYDVEHEFITVMSRIKSPYMVDQDILNVIFKDDTYMLDGFWNYEYHLPIWNPNYAEELPLKVLAEYHYSKEHAKIIHFAGSKKPWQYPQFEMSYYFWKYARQTPFYEEILQKGLFPPQQQVQQVIREVPAVREKIGYVDDYLLTKLKYAKYKLLSKILFGKKRVSCRQKRKELKREMKRIKSCYRMQEAEKKAADF